ncbi:MAG: hypothetical protein N3D10_01670 [Candidatus Micrarchaeota archaeon]|nr:hypothetical protein [Candidatus Micrarchaeota archaeon]
MPSKAAQKTTTKKEENQENSFDLYNPFKSEQLINLLSNLPLSNLLPLRLNEEKDKEKSHSLSFYLFLNSLKYSSLSWKELLEKKEFSFSNLSTAEYNTLNNTLEKLKKYGFNYSLKNINGIIYLSISLNISSENKKKLQELIDKNKTPFSLFSFLEPNHFNQSQRIPSSTFTPQDKTYAQVIPSKIKYSKEKKPETTTPQLTNYSLPRPSPFVPDKTNVEVFPKGGTSLDDISSFIVNLFVSPESWTHIFSSKATTTDYINTGLDLISLIGCSLVIKGVKNSVKFAKIFRKFLASKEKVEVFKGLPASHKIVLMSSDESLELFLKANSKEVENVIHTTLSNTASFKKAPAKIADNITKSIKAGKYEVVDGVIIDKSTRKFIGIIKDGQIFQFLPNLTSAKFVGEKALITYFSFYFLSDLAENVVKGDFESARESLRQLFAFCGVFVIIGLSTQTILNLTNKGLKYLSEGETIEKVTSKLVKEFEKEFKTQDSQFIEQLLKTFVDSLKNLSKKIESSKILEAMKVAFILKTSEIVLNELSEKKAPKTILIAEEKDSAKNNFVTSFCLPKSYFKDEKDFLAYKYVLSKFNVEADDNGVLTIAENIPSLVYYPKNAEEFWNEVFSRADKKYRLNLSQFYNSYASSKTGENSTPLAISLDYKEIVYDTFLNLIIEKSNQVQNSNTK